jgi:hypothetical protein
VQLEASFSSIPFFTKFADIKQFITLVCNYVFWNITIELIKSMSGMDTNKKAETQAKKGKWNEQMARRVKNSEI